MRRIVGGFNEAFGWTQSYGGQYTQMQWFDWVGNPQAWVGLLTLVALEIVLGVDNIVFISILAGKLPEGQRERARIIGLSIAMFTRVLLLLAIGWVMRLTTPLMAPFGNEITGKDVILILGGLFLVMKATHEIHDRLEGAQGDIKATRVAAGFSATIIQIVALDLVFSLDSVITAVGMLPADQIPVMILAVIIAVFFMMFASGIIAYFVERHPTLKMLALAFLVLIGVNLLAEGFGQHIPRGYTYFAMAFSVGVEALNLRLRPSETPPVRLRDQLEG